MRFVLCPGSRALMRTLTTTGAGAQYARPVPIAAGTGTRVAQSQQRNEGRKEREKLGSHRDAPGPVLHSADLVTRFTLLRSRSPLASYLASLPFKPGPLPGNPLPLVVPPFKLEKRRARVPPTLSVSAHVYNPARETGLDDEFTPVFRPFAD